MINSDLIVLDSTATMLNLQRDHKQSHCDLSARPILDTDVVIHSDVDVDIDVDLPENSAPMMDSDLIVLDAVSDTATMLNSQRDHKQLLCDLTVRPILDPDVVIHSDVNVNIDADLPEHSALMINSDLILFELNDAI